MSEEYREAEGRETLAGAVGEGIPSPTASNAGASGGGMGPEQFVDEDRSDDGDVEDPANAEEETDEPLRSRLLTGPRPGRRLVKPTEDTKSPLSPQQRLLILDTWRRSGLPVYSIGSRTS